MTARRDSMSSIENGKNRNGHWMWINARRDSMSSDENDRNTELIMANKFS